MHSYPADMPEEVREVYGAFQVHVDARKEYRELTDQFILDYLTNRCSASITSMVQATKLPHGVVASSVQRLARKKSLHIFCVRVECIDDINGIFFRDANTFKQNNTTSPKTANIRRPRYWEDNFRL